MLSFFFLKIKLKQAKVQKDNKTILLRFHCNGRTNKKYEINEQLYKIKWAADLRLDKNNVYLYTDFLLKKKRNKFLGTHTTNFKL